MCILHTEQFGEMCTEWPQKDLDMFEVKRILVHTTHVRRSKFHPFCSVVSRCRWNRYFKSPIEYNVKIKGQTRNFKTNILWWPLSGCKNVLAVGLGFWTFLSRAVVPCKGIKHKNFEKWFFFFSKVKYHLSTLTRANTHVKLDPN